MSLHTLLHVHSFNVIVSYLGLGQPPLKLRLITFNTQFICVYITSLVLLPSAARLRQFCQKCILLLHNDYPCNVILRYNLKMFISTSLVVVYQTVCINVLVSLKLHNEIYIDLPYITAYCGIHFV